MRNRVKCQCTNAAKGSGNQFIIEPCLDKVIKVLDWRKYTVGTCFRNVCSLRILNHEIEQMSV